MKILLTVILAGATLAGSAQWTPPFGIPAYHKEPPKEQLPPLVSYKQLEKEQMKDYQIRAYKAADAHPEDLYQIPCYCYCDRRHGHTSLHSCFETEHAAGCKECMKEAIYTEQMLRQHKNLDEIRAGLQRGEFREVQLEQSQAAAK
jgi:hypothetical protein